MWKKLLQSLLGNTLNVAFSGLGDFLVNDYKLDREAEFYKMSNAYNSLEAEKAWQRSIDYNSQVSNMRDAGLNPSLMYQSGVSGVGSSSAASAASSPSVDFGSLLGSLMRAVTLPSEIERNKASAAADVASANESESRADLNEVELQHRDDYLNASIRNLETQAALASEHIETQDSIRKLNKANISLADAQKTLTIYQGILANIDADQREDYLRLQRELALSEAEKNQAIKSYNYASLGLINAKISETTANIRLIEKQAFATYWYGMNQGAQSQINFWNYGYDKTFGTYFNYKIDLSRVGLIQSQTNLNSIKGTLAPIDTFFNGVSSGIDAYTGLRGGRSRSSYDGWSTSYGN